jgi:flagellar biosynthesis anti-sigma factor FlgM
MSNTIPPIAQSPLPLDAPGTPPQKQPAPPNATPPQSDSVTLSEAAQTTTQWLSAARDSNGVDQNAVERIRSALQNGSYNVPPEDLAQAIVTVLKETAPQEAVPKETT